MLSWLPTVLRSAGLDVYEMPGWETRRTRAGYTPQGVVPHHTATSTAWLDGHVAALLRDGRRDLAGPLSQLGLERDGTFVVIAAGRANHNGYGLWGNDSIGIEAYNDGVGEEWPDVQYDAYVRGVAAICAHMGWGPDQVKAHRETDPGRKIDPTGIDMDQFRAAVFNLEDDVTPDDHKQIIAGVRALLNENKPGRPWVNDRIGHTHNYAKNAMLSSADAVARIAALTAAVERLALGQGVDLGALEEAITRGTREALADLRLSLEAPE